MFAFSTAAKDYADYQASINLLGGPAIRHHGVWLYSLAGPCYSSQVHTESGRWLEC